MKRLQIECPPGYEIDQENSDLTKGIVKFKEVKKVLTYEDIAEKLFSDNKIFFLSDFELNVGISYIDKGNYCENLNSPDLSTTSEQLESILALNKLCNVAKYLNGDWLPDWSGNDKYNYYIYTFNNVTLKIGFKLYTNTGQIFFKSKKLAKQAIDILGEKEIIKALTLNH